MNAINGKLKLVQESKVKKSLIYNKVSVRGVVLALHHPTHHIIADTLEQPPKSHHIPSSKHRSHARLPFRHCSTPISPRRWNSMLTRERDADPPTSGNFLIGPTRNTALLPARQPQPAYSGTSTSRRTDIFLYSHLENGAEISPDG